MNSRAVRAVVLLTLLAPGGCGSAPTPGPPPGEDAGSERRLGYYRDLLGEEVRAREKLVEILSGVKDGVTMKAARPQIVAHERVVADLELREAQLGPPPAGMKERLQQEFGERLVQVDAALNREVARIRVLPGGLAFFDAIKELQPPKRP